MSCQRCMHVLRAVDPFEKKAFMINAALATVCQDMKFGTVYPTALAHVESSKMMRRCLAHGAEARALIDR